MPVTPTSLVVCVYLTISVFHVKFLFLNIGCSRRLGTWDTAKVFHRDLKPKNILANSDCKLKVSLAPGSCCNWLLTCSKLAATLSVIGCRCAISG